jgi:hypothetical protein
MKHDCDLNPLVLNRVRAEYIEMPGLTLKSEQLQRLCGIDRSVCIEVLRNLVDAGFLAVGEDGSYTRCRDEDTRRLHPAKATLDSRSSLSAPQRAHRYAS